MKYKDGDKVLYNGKKYDFGYISQEGYVILYEEGERNMQDSIAVPLSKCKKVSLEGFRSYCVHCMEVRDKELDLKEKVVRQKDTCFGPFNDVAKMLGGKENNIILRFEYCPDCGTVYFHDKGDL